MNFFSSINGPPTLVCSHILSDIEFQSLVHTIESNMHLYY